jgi:hypothetical protein
VLRDDGRWANRGIVIDASGAIAARYDKIHMFDVDLATGESMARIGAYTAGEQVVTFGLRSAAWGWRSVMMCGSRRCLRQFGRAACDAIAHSGGLYRSYR